VVLELKNISCGYAKKVVLKNVSISIKQGEILSLLGANGIGKTTLLKTIVGFLKPYSGEILINGVNSLLLNDKQRASMLSYVPQSHTPPFPFNVFDVVLMGRTPRLGMFATPNREDRKIVYESMEKIDVLHLKDRIYTELSGGERQMVLIARALATQTNILIFDEPTSNLDFGNQARILRQINTLAKDGFSIVMTTHNPEHVFQTNSNVVFIDNSKNITFGSKNILNEENLKSVYGIDVEIANLKLKNNKEVSTCIPIL